MKLNLLPTHVSKEKVTRTALLTSILLFVVCIVGAPFPGGSQRSVPGRVRRPFQLDPLGLGGHRMILHPRDARFIPARHAPR